MTVKVHSPYQPGNSILHRLDARVKVGLAFACILTIAITPARAWPVWILLLAIALVALVLAELNVHTVVNRGLLALPFILTALPLLFTIKGTPFLTLPWGWQATLEGALRTFSVILKAWLSLMVAIALTATTTFDDILIVLRYWGLPDLLISILSMTWRYIFLLAEEAQRLLRARTSRSGQSPIHGHRSGGNLTWRARVTGGMAGNLLLRGTERSERVYAAMLARGYDGEQRSLVTTSLTQLNRRLLFGGFAFLLILSLLGLIWG